MRRNCNSGHRQEEDQPAFGAGKKASCNGRLLSHLDVYKRQLVLIGFVDGRTDMYVDIAISYAVLGFITSVIVAKILGGRGDKDGH